MNLSADKSQIEAILGAMRDVATVRGTRSITEVDRITLSSAYRYMFKQSDTLDVGALPHTEPRDLASVLCNKELITYAVRFMSVAALVDGVLDRERIETVLVFAQALDVHEDYIAELAELAKNNLSWVVADMSRRNVDSILNRPWTGQDVNAWILPYRGDNADPGLVNRYESLRDLPAGTLGNLFWQHFKSNRYPFPGEPDALNGVFATPHDTTHVLSGYDTSFQGEILVSTFTAAMHRSEPMAGHILPVILSWHLGVSFNEAIRPRQGWLDSEKFWVAWDRGSETTTDIFASDWDFWAVAPEPADALRQRYSISPLDPAHAASPSG